MNKLMSDWLSNNWNEILKRYPEAELLLYYFSGNFSLFTHG